MSSLINLYTDDAIITRDELYRYVLTRWWGDLTLVKPPVPELVLPFVMLNPSKADAKLNDPTVRKVIGFAKRLGYYGAAIVNMYGFRATDPTELEHAADPVGPDNDLWIARLFSMMRPKSPVVFAWGQPGPRKLSAARISALLSLADRYALQPMALKVNEVGARAGHPSHPLMLSYGCQLRPWSPRVAA